jgi:transposase-like protein
MQQVRIKLRKGVPAVEYSESFKKQVVREYERGAFSKKQIQLKYGIKGKSRLLEWCRKYGRFAYHQATTNGRPMKDPQKQRIKELEKKLKAAELKLKVYDKLIEVTNRQLDADIIKKIEAKLSESWPQKKK